MAYKSLEDIIDVIRESVDVIDVMNRFIILRLPSRAKRFSIPEDRKREGKLCLRCQ